MREREVSKVDTPKKVGLDYPVDGVEVVELVEASVHADASIVHKRIDTTEFVECGIDETSALLLARDVGRHGDRMSANGAAIGDRLIQKRWVASGKDEARTLTREQPRDLPADSNGTAGDDGDVVAEGGLAHRARKYRARRITR
jgi:hypothetical protein